MDDEKKAEKADKSTKANKSEVDLLESFKKLKAAHDALVVVVEDIAARLPPPALSTSELKDALLQNPYQHLLVLETCRTPAGLLHKGHVFRADQMAGLAAMVQSQGLQLALVER